MLHPFGRSLNLNSQPCKLSKIWASECHSGYWWTPRGCEHWLYFIHKRHREAALIRSRSIWICIRHDRRHQHFPSLHLLDCIYRHKQACDLCLPSQTVRHIWFRRFVKTSQTGTRAFSKRFSPSRQSFQTALDLHILCVGWWKPKRSRSNRCSTLTIWLANPVVGGTRGPSPMGVLKHTKSDDCVRQVETKIW